MKKRERLFSVGDWIPEIAPKGQKQYDFEDLSYPEKYQEICLLVPIIERAYKDGDISKEYLEDFRHSFHTHQHFAFMAKLFR